MTTAPGTKRIDPRPLVRAVFSRDPYKVHRFWNTELMRKALDLAASHPPDAVHCQNFYTARYGKEISASRKVLYKENFETLLLERWAETASKPLLPALINIEKRRTLRFEMESCRWFDEVVTISNRDEKNLREAAREFPDTEKHLEDHLRTVLPSIQLDRYNAASMGEIPDPFPQDGRKRLLVTGSFNYLANVDGALWLTGEILPKLSGNKYSLWLVGQHPGPSRPEPSQPATRPCHWFSPRCPPVLPPCRPCPRSPSDRWGDPTEDSGGPGHGVPVGEHIRGMRRAVE